MTNDALFAPYLSRLTLLLGREGNYFRAHAPKQIAWKSSNNPSSTRNHRVLRRAVSKFRSFSRRKLPNQQKPGSFTSDNKHGFVASTQRLVVAAVVEFKSVSVKQRPRVWPDACVHFPRRFAAFAVAKLCSRIVQCVIEFVVTVFCFGFQIYVRVRFSSVNHCKQQQKTHTHSSMH